MEATLHTSDMSCSTIRIVRPISLSRRSSRTSSCFSVWFRPAPGSSSSRSSGSPATARASSTSFW